MHYLDARRLTGPNVLMDRACSILDVSCTAEEADRLIPFCESKIREMLAAIAWQNELICHARLADGISIAFSAPIDALYAATEINEWVWACCDAQFNGAEPADFATTVDVIRQAIATEVNPPMLTLARAAKDHGVAFLWDDDAVSVGMGSGAQSWPFRAVPEPSALDWSVMHDIPVGLITGTNGKTSTARIAKYILQSAGRSVGLSSTDWVAVNDRIIDRDDWSGPGGARMVLRQPDVDVAILETARGGLLRRGLGVNYANAALITNIAEDHLGDFGSQSRGELLNIKWVVSHAVAGAGALILNADDALLVGKSGTFVGRIVWFGRNEGAPPIAAHCACGGLAFVAADGDLVRIEGGQRELICRAVDVPITLEGAAAHNIANALAAAALCEQLGVSVAEIRHGLTTMPQDANPGRSNIYPIRGFKVLVDFAHNPEAMHALFALAHAIPARRRVLCFGQAGDRTDSQIRELVRHAFAIGLDLACIAELEHYRRGRDEREVYGIMREELIACGARAEQIRYFATESESFDAALEWAEDGDLVVMLDLGRSSDIHARLQAMGAK